MLFWSPFFAAFVLLPPRFWNMLSHSSWAFPSSSSSVTLHVNFKQWFSSRVLFVFHSFFLTNAFVKWSQEDDLGSYRGIEPWLLVSFDNGDKMRDNQALEYLCDRSFLPVLWIVSKIIRQMPFVVGGVFIVLNSVKPPKYDGLQYKQKDSNSVLIVTTPVAPKKKKLSCLKVSKLVLKSLVVLVFAMFVLKTNVFGNSKEGFWDKVGDVAALHQKWDVFGSLPKSYDWYTIKGKTVSGRDISILENGMFSYVERPFSGQEEPHSLSQHYGNHMVLQYFQQVFGPNLAKSHQRFAQFICDQYNDDWRAFADSLKTFEMFHTSRPLVSASQASVQSVPKLLFDHVCDLSAKQQRHQQQYVASQRQQQMGGAQPVIYGAVTPPPLEENAIDRQAPWLNIINGDNAVKPVQGGTTAPSSLHNLLKSWNGGDASVDKTSSAALSTAATTTPPSEQKKKGTGKWINGQWVADAS